MSTAAKVGDEPARCRRHGDATMAVSETIDDIGRQARWTDAGNAVRRRGTIAHPSIDDPFLQSIRHGGKCPFEMFQEDVGAPPVRRGTKAGQLHLPCDPEACLCPRENHLPVHHHDGIARATFDIRHHHMVAALRFERHLVSALQCKITCVYACRQDSPAAIDVAVIGLHGAQPVPLETEPRRPGSLLNRASPGRTFDQTGNKGPGIGKICTRTNVDTEPVMRSKPRLEGVQRLTFQLLPLDAVALAQPPGEAIGLVGCSVGVKEEMPVTPKKGSEAVCLRDRLVALECTMISGAC